MAAAEAAEASRRQAEAAQQAGDDAIAAARRAETADADAALAAAKNGTPAPPATASGLWLLAEETWAEANQKVYQARRAFTGYCQALEEALTDREGAWTAQVLPAYEHAVRRLQQAVQDLHAAHADKAALEGLLGRLTGAYRTREENYHTQEIRRLLDKAASTPAAIRQLQADIAALTEQEDAA